MSSTQEAVGNPMLGLKQGTLPLVYTYVNKEVIQHWTYLFTPTNRINGSNGRKYFLMHFYYTFLILFLFIPGPVCHYRTILARDLPKFQYCRCYQLSPRFS